MASREYAKKMLLLEKKGEAREKHWLASLHRASVAKEIEKEMFNNMVDDIVEEPTGADDFRFAPESSEKLIECIQVLCTCVQKLR